MVDLQPGAVVARRFEVIEIAGRGGMGAVYRARDLVAGEVVALKIVAGATRQESTRFEREALALTELRHASVVRYVAHGTTGEGAHYLAMEWLDGEDLETRLRREPLSLVESLELARRVAEALAAAHARGIVHRDIKPANLFLVKRDPWLVKVIDFGLARGRNAVALTRTGVMIGTPQYMAPEQARGLHSVDARADVFSLGCVLYECLAGVPPFDGEHLMAVLAKILFDNPVPLGVRGVGTPPAVEALVARMLAKDPDDRYADGSAAAEAILQTGTHDEPAPRQARGSTYSITAGEQRVLSVVLASSTVPTLGDTLDQASAATISTGESTGGRDDGLSARIASLGGTLERLADGSLVVTVSGAGAPTDQAAKAARCALLLRATLPFAPISLATGRGEVLARLPAGEVIDRAAALLSDMQPGLVPIDEVTAGLLSTRFDVRRDDTRLMLAGEHDAQNTSRTLLGRPQPCVGRDRELGTLASILGECVEESVARAVIVTGPAGIGKSRVGIEFLSAVRSRDDALQIWIARGDPMSAGSPFGILAQLISAATGVHAEGTEEMLRLALRSFVPSSEVDRIATFFGEILGIRASDAERPWLKAARLEAGLMNDQLRRAWTEFVMAAVTHRPVLVVLEDLQWGDLPSVRLLEAALKACRERPLMVAAFARPTLFDAFPNLWAMQGPTEIRLGELSRKSAERLVRNGLGADAPATVVARIVERGAGSPFFLEELVRAASEGQSESLPETVVAMVQARLDGFDPDVRRVLRAASVFGKTFWRGSVTALVGERAAVDLDAQLAWLAEREAIEPRGCVRFTDDPEFVFRQEAVREAAYAMLTSADRVTGHRLAADWLAAHGESDPVVLATHFELGGDREQAVISYVAAAEQALLGEDLTRVIAHAARGMACGAEGEARGALCLAEADALRWRGEFQRAEALALEAVSLLEPMTERHDSAVGLAVLAAAKLGHFDLVERIAAGMIREEVPRAITAARVNSVCRAAAHLFLSGRVTESAPLFQWIRDLDATLTGELSTIQGRVDSALAVRDRLAGDPGEVMMRTERSARCCDLDGNLRAGVGQRVNLTAFLINAGQYARAEQLAAQCMVEAERLGADNLLAFAASHRGEAFGKMGRYAEGIPMLVDSGSRFERQGDARMASAAFASLAFVLAVKGDLEEAVTAAHRAVAFANTLPARSAALATLGLALVRSGDLPGALAASAEAYQIVTLDDRSGDADVTVLIAYAESLDANGRRAEAVEVLESLLERIHARAAQFSDPALVESYTHGVWECVRANALAAAWSVATARSS